MKSKSLWRIALDVPSEAEEAILDLFARVFGQPASSYVDLEKRLATISIYCEEKPNVSSAQRAEIAAGFKRIRECGLNIGQPKLSVRKLPRQDWAESWKRHFQPIEIGLRLLIKPSWSKQHPKKGQAIIILDPGLSFGTGQHPTTEFCLREIVAHAKPFTIHKPSDGNEATASSPRPSPPLEEREKIRPVHGALAKSSFLDIGTGSGILAIAAARLGYGRIDAFDFDPEAIRVATANAKRNRVLDKIHFFEQDVTKLPRTGVKYSVICANLISNLLISARDRILARLAADGLVIVAGILKTEFHLVQRAYEEAGLQLVASRGEKEWRSGSFAREESRKRLTKVK
jgi:ribosomal protein L11 methyltransferase